MEEEILKQILEEIKGLREDINELMAEEEDDEEDEEEEEDEEPDDSIFDKQ